MADRKWTDAQEEAIHAEGCNILVSAAAGSGKTAVLVERVIRKITDPENPSDIDRLLVMTFTRAAAAQMKSKIFDAIRESARSILFARKLSAIISRKSIWILDTGLRMRHRSVFFRQMYFRMFWRKCIRKGRRSSWSLPGIIRIKVTISWKTSF